MANHNGRPRCQKRRKQTITKFKTGPNGKITTTKRQGMAPCGYLLDRNGVCWFCRAKAPKAVRAQLQQLHTQGVL